MHREIPTASIYILLAALVIFTISAFGKMEVVYAEEEISPVAAIEIEPIEVEPEPDFGYSREDINLLALVTVAEAEGESELGKRLVIDTILNRVDSPYFPDTIYDVVYQPNQFESMWNGRVERSIVTPDVVELVEEELLERTNSEVIFFRTNRYSDYGVPMFQEGNHYFSKYE